MGLTYRKCPKNTYGIKILLRHFLISSSHQRASFLGPGAEVTINCVRRHHYLGKGINGEFFLVNYGIC
jgi:hypothetical protein